MKIFLSEIKEIVKDIELSSNDKWAVAVLHKLDEKNELGIPTKEPKSVRALSGKMSLQKVHDLYLLNGTIQTGLKLYCSRCAKSYLHDCSTEFTAVYTKSPKVSAKKVNHKSIQPLNPLEQTEDYDITYLTNDYIDLSEVFEEQIQLQIPFQPLCGNDCNGMCQHCGADLNEGRCACSVIKKESPFSALKDIKLKETHE